MVITDITHGTNQPIVVLVCTLFKIYSYFDKRGGFKACTTYSRCSLTTLLWSRHTYYREKQKQCFWIMEYGRIFFLTTYIPAGGFILYILLHRPYPCSHPASILQGRYQFPLTHLPAYQVQWRRDNWGRAGGWKPRYGQGTPHAVLRTTQEVSLTASLGL